MKKGGTIQGQTTKKIRGGEWRLDDAGGLAATKVAEATKTKQIKKFDKLHACRFGPNLDTDKVVRNLSHRTLTEDEKRVLALGLNFAKTIPVPDVIAATEATARQVDPDTAERLRSGVSSVLRSTKPPKSNLSSCLRRAVKDVRKDETIVILPADKGNATVVMDRTEYVNKLETMLADDTYRKLKKDPTTRVESKITQALKNAKQRGYMSREQRLYLSPQSSFPPQLYGLPKYTKQTPPSDQLSQQLGPPHTFCPNS